MAAIAEYHDGMPAIIADSGNPDIFKISPSSVADFFTSTSQYYHEQVLGEDKAFNGSTATHLGTIVHAYAEAAANNEDLSNYESTVTEFLATITDPEVDKQVILSLWYNMATTLVDNVITDDRTIVGTEDFMFSKLNDDVYVGGTYDALIKDTTPFTPSGGLCVVDYKTASTKPQGINWKYRLQAYTYAWMLTEAGKNITSIELCFVCRPTKTLPVRYFPFRERYTPQNHEWIGKQLALIAEHVSAFKHKPELRHLLSMDMDLKHIVRPSFPGTPSA